MGDIMIKIYKKTYRNITFKGNIAELYVCNFNGKITYKYIDKLDCSIRTKSCTDISSAVKEMREIWKKLN